MFINHLIIGVPNFDPPNNTMICHSLIRAQPLDTHRCCIAARQHLCMCIYSLCMYIYIHMYVVYLYNLYTHLCLHIIISAYTDMYVHVHIYIYIYIYMHITYSSPARTRTRWSTLRSLEAATVRCWGKMADFTGDFPMRTFPWNIQTFNGLVGNSTGNQDFPLNILKEWGFLWKFPLKRIHWNMRTISRFVWCLMFEGGRLVLFLSPIFVCLDRSWTWGHAGASWGLLAVANAPAGNSFEW